MCRCHPFFACMRSISCLVAGYLNRECRHWRCILRHDVSSPVLDDIPIHQAFEADTELYAENFWIQASQECKVDSCVVKAQYISCRCYLPIVVIKERTAHRSDWGADCEPLLRNLVSMGQWILKAGCSIIVIGATTHCILLFLLGLLAPTHAETGCVVWTGHVNLSWEGCPCHVGSVGSSCRNLLYCLWYRML